MYYELFELLHTHIYGIDAVLTPDMSLTLTMLSTIGSLLVVAVPFIVVWIVIKMITGGWR